MGDKPVVRVFIACHKACEAPETEVLCPIQVGTAIRGELPCFTLHDDVGENISDKNRMYCELTAQYWAWKNVDADYYGFMHYRRYFSLCPEILPEDGDGNIVLPYLSPGALKRLNLTDESLTRLMERCDVVSPAPQNTQIDGNVPSVYEQYRISKHQRIEDLDLVMQIIRERHPDYVQAMEQYLYGQKAYFCNMYILRRDVFSAYCEWLFDILAEHERRSDLEDYDINEYRVSGFLAERLWGIFYTKLQMDRSLRCVELQRCLFQSCGKLPDISPAFASDNVPVVMTLDERYCPGAAVMLRSLAEHANPGRRYDVLILHSSVLEASQERICRELASYEHVCIRFFDASLLLASTRQAVRAGDAPESCWKLLIHELLPQYDKVVYLDADCIVLDDVGCLYDTELNDAWMAAVRDVETAGCCHGFDEVRGQYFRTTMGAVSPNQYFGAGVLLMNLAELRKGLPAERVLQEIGKGKWIFPVQDVLNRLCTGHIRELDMKWNVTAWRTHKDGGDGAHACEYAPHGMYLAYMEARKTPSIIHFSGKPKPWNYPDRDMAALFWAYAEKAGRAEELCEKMEQPKPMQPDNTPRSADLQVDELEETLYLDGLYVKLIKKMNGWFPKGSARRERLKRIAGFFMKG